MLGSILLLDMTENFCGGPGRICTAIRNRVYIIQEASGLARTGMRLHAAAGKAAGESQCSGERRAPGGLGPQLGQGVVLV